MTSDVHRWSELLVACAGELPITQAFCTRGNSCSAKSLGVASKRTCIRKAINILHNLPMELLTQVCRECWVKPAVCICEHDAGWYLWTNLTKKNWRDVWIKEEAWLRALLPTLRSPRLTVSCSQGLQATLLYYLFFTESHQEIYFPKFPGHCITLNILTSFGLYTSKAILKRFYHGNSRSPWGRDFCSPLYPQVLKLCL